MVATFVFDRRVGSVPGLRRGWPTGTGRRTAAVTAVLALVAIGVGGLAPSRPTPAVPSTAPVAAPVSDPVGGAAAPAARSAVGGLRFEADAAGALVGAAGAVGLALHDDRFDLVHGPTGERVSFGFVGGTSTVPVLEDPLPDRRTYLVGSDPAAWRSDVVGHAQARYVEPWAGTDLVLREADEGGVEFDLVVAPGADPAAARLRVSGAEDLRVGADGDLVATTSSGELRQSAPVSFQDLPSGRVDVWSRFVVEGDTVGFEVGSYDPAWPLVIDPTIGFSTYFGGPGNDTTSAVAVDANGNIYVVGTQWSWGSPNKTEIKTAPLDNDDVYVVKLDPTGTQVLKTTFIGGAGADTGVEVAVDGSGRAYVVGKTTSSNFPTAGANAQTAPGGAEDGFLVRLNSAGTALEYGTYLGGSSFDQTEGLALQAGGYAVVSGATKSTDFPVGAGGYQGAHAATGVGCMTPKAGQELFDGYLLRFKTEGVDAGRTYGTFFGGGCYDNLRNVAIGPDGAIYAGGYTYSSNAPLLNGRADDPGPDGDSLVVKFPAAPVPGAGAPLFASQLGGSSDDIAWDIAVDGGGQATVVGKSGSADLYGTSCAHGSMDAFAVELNAAGTAVTGVQCLAGNGDDFASAIVIDASGGSWMVGNTTSTDLTVVDGIPGQVAPTGGTNTQMFVMRWNAAGTVTTRSYLGGTGLESDAGNPKEIAVALDPAGNVVIAGVTLSTNYPTTAGVVDTTLDVSLAATWDTVVTKLATGAVATVPGAPAKPGVAAGAGSVTVSWSAPADTGGSPITRYDIRPYKDGGVQAVIQGVVSPHVVSGLEAGASYQFQVRAVNAVGTGAWSAKSNVAVPTAGLSVPGAPPKPTTSSAARVAWTPPASNGGATIDQYWVLAHLPGQDWGEPAVAEALVGRTGRTATLTGLVPGTTYRVRVRAHNSEGWSWTSEGADLTVYECDSARFWDVGSSHPFCSNITWLSDAGVTNGYGDGSFRGGGTIQRQAMAAWLFRYDGQTKPAGPCDSGLSDVPPSHPFCHEISWMVHEGISTGYPDDTFRPGTSVDRQAMAAFLFRYAGQSVPGGTCSSGFSDVPATHPFCAEIAWLARQGITTGYTDGTFRGGQAIQRQAMAAFLHRYEPTD